MCITTNHPDTKSNSNPNPTTIQREVVSIQLNIVACPACPEKFIIENVVPLLILLLVSRSQWSSGKTLACSARGPRFESRCGQKFVFSRKSLRYAAFGTGCTLTAVPRSTQPARDGKWVSASWLSNNTWRWANVRSIAAYRQTQRSS